MIKEFINIKLQVGLPVTFHFPERDKTFLWNRLFGIRLGRFYFGIIGSQPDEIIFQGFEKDTQNG